MRKLILITVSCFLLAGFADCRPSAPSTPPVNQEDKLLADYEKYIDDIIAEYKKIDAGDVEAYKNIAPLSEKGTEIKEEIRYSIFNEEQLKKFNELEEKRKEYFNNR